MCTSVQNIHIPTQGILVNNQQVSFEKVAKTIANAVDKHLADDKNAAFLCGALVNDDILQTIDKLRIAGKKHGTILRDSAPYSHPEFENARTATPLMIIVDSEHSHLYRDELFGPISFIIKGENIENCLTQATKDAKDKGAITSHVYSIDEFFLDQAQDAYNNAGASVACNLIGMPINFAAAYSDFHVTGLNPAGNACLTDLAFVTSRFRVVQRKSMVKSSQE
jgi:acyl-CoA reductase-like NAD-dependent aldehyde dehydrogenase